MSKIILDHDSSNLNPVRINENFRKIEEEFNEKTLYRDNPIGEPNEMENHLDMNGNRIYNLPSPKAGHEPLRLLDIDLIPEEIYEYAEEARDWADKSKEYYEDTVEALIEGGVYIGNYTAGLEIKEYTEFFGYNGIWWRVSPDLVLPYMTTGDWSEEKSLFVAVGDQLLREELIDTNHGVSLIAKGVVSVENIHELLSLPSSFKRDDLRFLVKGYHPDSSTGGGEFYYDSSKEEDYDGGLILNGFIRIFDGPLRVEWFGAVQGEDISNELTSAIEAANMMGGNTINISGHYRVEKTIGINYDNIFIVGDSPENTVLERTDPSVPGFMVHFGKDNETNGGGIKNITLRGVTNPTTGNGGLSFGTAEHYSNGWIADNIVCDSWGQYGVGIHNGNSWRCTNTTVLNHGKTSEYISSCMGFYVFPRMISSYGVIDNIYSEISEASVANTAAIKLQTHQEADFRNIYAKGGTEECIVIDSVGGIISNVTARSVTRSPGIAIGNYSSVHEFRGRFVLDGVDCNDSNFTRSIVIASNTQDDVTPKLYECVIRNVKCFDFAINNRTSWRNCIFENIWCASGFFFDHESLSVLPPNIPIQNNRYSNIFTANCSLSGNRDHVSNVDVRYSSQSLYRGNGSKINGWTAEGMLSNSFTLRGDNNSVANLLVTGSQGRVLWVAEGENNFISGVGRGSTVLDNGTNTNLTHFVTI